jgi:hypothetical protein
MRKTYISDHVSHEFNVEIQYIYIYTVSELTEIQINPNICVFSSSTNGSLLYLMTSLVSVALP